MLTPLRSCFSVLCVCVGCLVWCLCPELYSQPGFWILTIFPVPFQFFFVLILMPPKRKVLGSSGHVTTPDYVHHLLNSFWMPSLPVAMEAFADSPPPITEPDVPASTSATAIAIWPSPPYLPRLLPSWLHKSLVQSQFNFSVCSVHSCLLDRHHITNLCQIQVHLWEGLLHSLPLHVQLLVLVPW